VPAESRTVEEIRAEMAAQRDELRSALADLRTGMDAKRRPASAVTGLLVIGLVALVLRRIVRRLVR
jgi:hypothetical protein